MGRGSYKASDWAKLRSSRGITSTSNASSIFTSKKAKDAYLPKFIDVRESRDSEDSPNSTPIILGFDVTGSMGYLAEEIAKNALNETITNIYAKNPVTNPHVMCAAFVEPEDRDGLQVTQFEADIRVVEQLLDLRVGFGGNWFSYDSLLWYFAAKHTAIDSYEKRGKKGILIGIGDEIADYEYGHRITKNDIKTMFRDDVDHDITLEEAYKMVAEKYEIIHIITGANQQNAWRTWTELPYMKGRVAILDPEDINCLSEVITSILQLINKGNREDIIKQWDEKDRAIVRKAIKEIQF